MAKNSATVYDFLGKLWTPALARAKAEAASFQRMIDEEGKGFKLESWDWWYYAEKVRKAQYDLDDEMLRPVLRARERPRRRLHAATKLYGITFEERKDIPTYNGEVRVYEVKEADGKHIGLLYTDYFPRDNKQGGAWCGGFRYASKIGGKIETPLITNCGNFVRARGDTPSLLNFDEVNHPVPRVRAQPAQPSFRMRVPDGAERGDRFRRAPVADHGELGHRSGIHENVRAALQDRRADTRRAHRQDQEIEHLQPGIHDDGVSRRLDPRHGLAHPGRASRAGRERVRKRFVRPHRAHPGQNRATGSAYFAHIFGDGGYASGYDGYIWAEVLERRRVRPSRTSSPTGKRPPRSCKISPAAASRKRWRYKKFRGREPKIELLIECCGPTEPEPPKPGRTLVRPGASSAGNGPIEN